MRKERGAITIITLTTVLFITAFLIGTFTIIANRRQAQAEIKAETEDIYESNIYNAEYIYRGYFAETNEVIPITTAEQLLKIGTNENIVANDKIYTCKPDANYRLESNIEFAVEDYKDIYPNMFENVIVTDPETGGTRTEKRWIDIEKQKTNGTLTGTFDYNNKTINSNVYEAVLPNV